MKTKAWNLFLTFILVHSSIFVAAAYGAQFTGGAGAVIGFSLGVAKTYTSNNDMFCWYTLLVILTCIAGGTIAGLRT